MKGKKPVLRGRKTAASASPRSVISQVDKKIIK
jgi:hypothetical protein